MAEHFYKDGLRFECTRCSYCCGKVPRFVYLSKEDLETLANYFSLSIADFVKKYCRWVNYYYGKTVLALQTKKNHDCILWDKGCVAYEARPVQCSTFPFWSWILKDRETWEECAAECPGMNNGRLFTKVEIKEIRSRFNKNIPITKEQAKRFFGIV
ncbi:MAG: YkgJ family cysteine cluster protein [Treponema sp.]|nr:YkgJ family cysteine cluster protein [Treponema sp.]